MYKEKMEQKQVSVSAGDWYNNSGIQVGTSAVQLGAQNLGYTLTASGSPSTVFSANTLNR